jgi:hypothetical protein
MQFYRKNISPEFCCGVIQTSVPLLYSDLFIPLIHSWKRVIASPGFLLLFSQAAFAEHELVLFVNVSFLIALFSLFSLMEKWGQCSAPEHRDTDCEL